MPSLYVCKAEMLLLLVQAAQSDLVWRSLHARRWGESDFSNDQIKLSKPVSAQIRADEILSPQPVQQLSWRNKYRQRHLAELGMQCPECQTSKVIPIVYGFPSHLLVRNMKAQKLRMGNDHLIDGQPLWTCTGCKMEFNHFPYRSLELTALYTQGAKLDTHQL